MTEDEMLEMLKADYYNQNGRKLSKNGVDIGEDTMHVPTELEGDDYNMGINKELINKNKELNEDLMRAKTEYYNSINTGNRFGFRKGGFITDRGDAGEPIYGDYEGPALSQGGGLVEKQKMDGDHYRQWGPSGYKGDAVSKGGGFVEGYGERSPGTFTTKAVVSAPPGVREIFDRFKDSDLNKRLFDLRMKLQNKIKGTNNNSGSGGDY